MTPFLLTVLIAAGLLFAVKIFYVLSTAGVLPVTKGALYVSTSRPRIDALLEAMPMKPNHVLYDLGCGDGRILRAAARRYGLRAVGFEINPLAFVQAKVRCLPYRNITVEWRDFRRADISAADVVFCYLFPDAIRDIQAKLENEAKPRARVVSANFPMPGWTPTQVIRPAPQRHSDPIYIYSPKDIGPADDRQPD